MGSGGRKGAARQYNKSKVPRLRWTADLHRSFVRAIDYLGGQHSTTSTNYFSPLSLSLRNGVISKPKAHHLNRIVRKLSSKEKHKSRFFMISSETRDEPGEPAKRCASPLSLAIDQKAANAISCRPSEGSCVISPSPRSFSDCSGPPGRSFVGQRVNLELSLSICGS
ncbi:hypothetical protein ABZP36_032356 [Zizania latifolia]